MTDTFTHNKQILFPLLAAILCVLFGGILWAGGLTANGADGHTITADLSAIENLSKNSTLAIPAARFSGDNTVRVAHTVTYPDGRSSSYSQVKLDSSGTYHLRYSAAYNGQEYSLDKAFYVRNAPISILSGTDSIITDNVAVPAYAEAEGTGVKVTATKNGASVRYNTIVDIERFTSEDVLAEILITPEVAGSLSISSLILTLTDINDASKYMQFKLNPREDMWKAYATASCNGNTFLGNTSGFQEPIKWGVPMMSSFVGKFGSNPSYPIKIFYDNSECAFYASPYLSGYGKRLILDLNNDAHLPPAQQWTGFTEGKAYLSISVSELTDRTASFMLLKLAGLDLSGSVLVDNKAPNIVIDYMQYRPDALPKAVVGKNYPFFPSYAFDAVDGILPAVSVKVFYGPGKQYVATDGKGFVPTKTGTYYITYSARDESGNTATEVLAVAAGEAYDIPLKRVAAANATTAFAGEFILIDPGSAVGGAGNYTIQVAVQRSGQSIPLDFDGNRYSFYANQTGTYVVRYILSDHFGTQVTDAEILTVSGEIYLKEPPFPAKLIAGERFTLPAPEAYYYSGGIRRAVVTVSAAGETLGEDLTFTVPDSPEVTVTYTTETVRSVARTLTRDIPVVKPVASEEGFVTSMFDGQSMAVGTLEKAYIEFKATAAEGDASLTFIRKIASPVLSMQFNSIPEKSDFNSFNIKITDAEQSGKTVTLRLKNEGLPMTGLYMGDTKLGDTSSTFDNSVPFLFLLKGNKIYDYENASAGTITTFDDGTKFTGFSAYVYLTLEMEGLRGEGAFHYELICNQVLSLSYNDRIAPMLITASEIADYSTVDKNTVITLPAASCYDVFGFGTVTLTVEGPDGMDIVSDAAATAPTTFTATAFGVYTAWYIVTDNEGNSDSISFLFVVNDETPPTIRVTFTVANAKAGAGVTLPTATVEDENVDYATAKVYVIAPDGSRLRVTDSSFTPPQAGDYSVVYYAYDSYGNLATAVYILTVH